MSDTNSRSSASCGREKDQDSRVQKASVASSSELRSDSSDSVEEEIRETAPAFERWHDMWDDVFKHLREYEAQTSQLYRIRSGTKVSTRNTKIKSKKKWKESELIPESFGDYYKTLLCTHGWGSKPRDGQRTGYHARTTGCSVNLSATVSRCPTTDTWRICVTTHNRTHNHRLRREVYDNYSSSRRVTDPGVLDFVDELVQAGAKPKRILKYLQDTTGKRVILRDVHNLVQRLKAKRRGQSTVEERLETVLRKFCSYRGNQASIFVDDTKATQTITLLTRQMKRFFEAFPEVVMLDSTHGTNTSRYKLFSFMIDDIFGHGQYVQHSLVENESHACMKDAIEAFKENNPTWDRIRVFMIDKDFGELSLLQKEFPLARILICHFHLKKYLRTEMAKAIYGGRNGVDVDRVEDAVDMMVKAIDEEAYDRGLRYMYYILDGFDEQGDLPKPKHPLLDYFVRNWHSCNEMWTVYKRGHVAHLGNHTNNRYVLESAWGALKEILKSEMELDECVETLYFLQSTAEMEYASNFNVVGSRHYHGADEMLLRLAAFVSPYAFDIVRKEYDLIKSGALVYGGGWLQAGIVKLESERTHREYTVDTSTFVCSCFFMRTLLLPCHHTMYLRAEMKKKKVIPLNYIHPRWLLQAEANRPDEDESDTGISCSSLRIQASHMRSLSHAVLNGTTKWKTAMDIAGGVVESMSSQGTRTFLQMAEALREFGESVRQGVVPTLTKSPTTVSSRVEARVDLTGDSGLPNRKSDHETSRGGSEVACTNASSVAPTQKTPERSQSSDNCDEDKVDSNGAATPVSESGYVTRRSDRLLAETNRIISRVRDMVSSDSDDNDAQLFELVPPAGKKAVTKRSPRPTKKPAAKASVHAATKEIQTTDQSVSSTSQLGKDANQSGEDANQSPKELVDSPIPDKNQLASETNQLVNNTNELVNQSDKGPSQLVLRKRRPKERCESAADFSGDGSSAEGITGQFRVSTSVKSKGRPKIRRKQAREAKKLRMEESTAEATALVQGTLVPEKDMSLVRKTLACSFNVQDALHVLHSITKVDAPTWKATSIIQLARKQKVHKKVTIVFPKNYVTQCIAGIKMYRKSLPSEHDAGGMGVSIKKLGTFTEKDLTTMNDWHDLTPKFDAFSDLAAWVRVSRFTRIVLPTLLNNCVTVDLQACANRLEMGDLKATVDTRFGQVGIEEMSFFRRSEWLDDSCMKLAMSHIMDQDQDDQGRSRIGGVNPLYARVFDEAMKLQVIASSPLNPGNRLILVPVFLDGHWAGVVFDIENGKAVVFDPMQTNKYYNEACQVAKDYFGNLSAKLQTIRQRAPRQEDTNSCGPLVLLFFECMVRGMPVPNASQNKSRICDFDTFS